MGGTHRGRASAARLMERKFCLEVISRAGGLNGWSTATGRLSSQAWEVVSTAHLAGSSAPFSPIAQGEEENGVRET